MKTKWFIFFIFIACLGNLKAQSYVTSVPYELDVFGKMLIQVNINGHPGKFLFDTGAPTCVTHDFAEKTGVKQLQAIPFEDSNGQVKEMGVGIISHIKLGTINFTRVESAIWEKGNVIEQFGIDGVIGNTLFGNKVVYIDARKKEISIASDIKALDLCTADTVIPVKMHNDSQGLPIFDLLLDNGEKETVMFDAGAHSAFEIAETSVDKIIKNKGAILLNTGYGTSSVGSGGIGEKTEMYRLKIDTMAIGNAKFSNVTTISTSGTLSRIGSQILNYGRVCIDYKNKLFYFFPYSQNIPSLYEKEWDIVITAENNRLTAGIVWGKLREDIESGDIIVGINDKRYDNIDATELMMAKGLHIEGDRAKITVKNAKTGKETTVIMCNR